MKYLYLSKINNKLVAYDEETFELLSKIKEGEVLKVPLQKAVNPAFYRKWRSLVNIIFDNQIIYDTKEDLITEIKLKTGWYDEHITLSGELKYIPKSLSFENITEAEFDEFYKNAIQACLTHFVPVDNQQLINQIARF